jgi:hypothetical protein
MDFALDGIDTLRGSVAGAPLTVAGIDGRPLLNSKGEPHVITLLGPDSPVYQRLVHQQTQKRIDAAAAAHAKGETAPADPEEAKADAIDVMARCTKGWTGFLDRQGAPIEFSVDAARQLYTRFPVIREQVDSFIVQRRNFLPVSSRD